MKNFSELVVWKESKSLALSIYRITKNLPESEKYGLISQMRRCAVSIPSNIAEGCSRSNPGLLHFLRISLGSSYELETQLILSVELKLLNGARIKKIQNDINILQRRIISFSQKISQQE